jgi:hypothetical protein
MVFRQPWVRLRKREIQDVCLTLHACRFNFPVAEPPFKLYFKEDFIDDCANVYGCVPYVNSTMR